MRRRDTLKGLASTAIVSGFLADLTPVASRAAIPPLVLTQVGPVVGHVSNGVQVFLGLRYGQDTALARFQPPKRPLPWISAYEAAHYGTASPQVGDPDPFGHSEDCLFLNVWTPDASNRKLRPVMFYIHGGAYSTGSGSSPLYCGENLCHSGDVVVVTVNHRLNCFGYLYLARHERQVVGMPGHLESSGNVGQLDLHLALEWVRDNIANFGGDPNCVLVFGQSGGGAKIATMMATPRAKGLFQRAATMSGQQITASGPENASRRAAIFLQALGLKSDREGLLKVQTFPVQALIGALMAQDPIIDDASLYFGPVLDDYILTRHPFWPDAPDQSQNIPMMIGNTHDETRAFLGNDPHNFDLSWDELPAKLPKAYRVDIDPYLVIETYRKLYPDMSASDVFFAATTAGRSWRGAIEEDEARAKAGCPAFAYQIDWKSPRAGGRYRAQHMIDIPLVFRTTAVPGSLSEDGPSARKMSALISDAFIAFARTGSPQTPALPDWRTYSLERRETMVLDDTPCLIDDPRGEERRLFAKVPFIQSGT